MAGLEADPGAGKASASIGMDSNFSMCPGLDSGDKGSGPRPPSNKGPPTERFLLRFKTVLLTYYDTVTILRQVCEKVISLAL